MEVWFPKRMKYERLERVFKGMYNGEGGVQVTVNMFFLIVLYLFFNNFLLSLATLSQSCQEVPFLTSVDHRDRNPDGQPASLWIPCKLAHGPCGPPGPRPSTPDVQCIPRYSPTLVLSGHAPHPRPLCHLSSVYSRPSGYPIQPGGTHGLYTLQIWG